MMFTAFEINSEIGICGIIKLEQPYLGKCNAIQKQLLIDFYNRLYAKWTLHLVGA